MSTTVKQTQKHTFTLPREQTVTVSADALSLGHVVLEAASAGNPKQSNTAVPTGGSVTFGPYPQDERFSAYADTGEIVVADFVQYNYASAIKDQADQDSLIGTLSTALVSGTVEVVVTRSEFFYKLDFTLTAAQIPVTDAGVSGSYGSLKLLDLLEGAWAYQGCRQDYTAFEEGAALTGGVGDAVFEIGIGTAAISSAADGILASNQDNIGSDVNVTLVGGAGTGTTVNGNTSSVQGTAAAGSINLNWSGTAATIDANSTIDVTGTFSILVAFIGDD